VEEDCAALLLNHRFAESMRLALKMQQEINDEICATHEQDYATRTKLEKLEHDLEQYRSRRRDLEREAHGVAPEEDLALQKKFSEVRDVTAIYNNRKEKQAADQYRRQTHLQARYQAFFEIQKVANRFLEPAFISAGIYKPSPVNAATSPNSGLSVQPQIGELRRQNPSNKAVKPTNAGSRVQQPSAEPTMLRISAPSAGLTQQHNGVRYMLHYNIVNGILEILDSSILLRYGRSVSSNTDAT